MYFKVTLLESAYYLEIYVPSFDKIKYIDISSKQSHFTAAEERVIHITGGLCVFSRRPIARQNSAESGTNGIQTGTMNSSGDVNTAVQHQQRTSHK